MTILSVFNGKGGSGKSTLAQVLGVELGASWIDTDPQASTADWGAVRGDGRVHSATAATAALKLVRQLQGHQVVDTAGALTEVSQAVLPVSDVIVIPTSGRENDLRAIGKTVGVIHKLGLGDRTLLVLTRVHPRQSVAQLQELLAPLGLPVCPHRLAERAVYDRAQITGQTAAEVEPGGPAAVESAAVAEWVLSHA